MTNNQLNYLAHKESVRHAREDESLKRASLAETTRSNLAKEAEQLRSNMTREEETKRSNLANELINNEKFKEDLRHHLASEGLDQQKIDETMRSNKMNEAIKWATLAVQFVDNNVKNMKSTQNSIIGLIGKVLG